MSFPNIPSAVNCEKCVAVLRDNRINPRGTAFYPQTIYREDNLVVLGDSISAGLDRENSALVHAELRILNLDSSNHGVSTIQNRAPYSQWQTVRADALKVDRLQGVRSWLDSRLRNHTYFTR